MKLISGRSEIGVLVSEKLIGYLSREKHPYVGGFMNPFTKQVHSDRSTDRSNIISSENRYDLRQRIYHVFLCNDNLGMDTADIIGNLFGILKIDGVPVHTYCKGADRFAEKLCGNCTDKRGIKSSAEKKSERRVGIKAFFYAANELFLNFLARCIEGLMNEILRLCDVMVANKFVVGEIMSRREGNYLFAQRNEIFGFACEENCSAGVISVKKRADTDRISCGDELLFLSVVQNESKFGVKHFKHFAAVFTIERKENFTV